MQKAPPNNKAKGTRRSLRLEPKCMYVRMYVCILIHNPNPPEASPPRDPSFPDTLLTGLKASAARLSRTGS